MAPKNIPETPKRVPASLPEGKVDQYRQRRVCARCYGDLQRRSKPGSRDFEVYCPFCAGAWGYTTVTRRYAEQLGQVALADAFDAKKRFEDIVPNPHKGKTAEQLLRELGF